MAKELFLLRERERATPTVRDPSVSSGCSESSTASSSRNSLLFDTTGQLPFKILDEISKNFSQI
jgi:hypothetical protein